MRVHPQKDETGPDRAPLVKAKNAVLIGLGRLQLGHQRAKIGDQPVQPRNLGQFPPVAKEKEHEVRPQFRVGLGHLMPRQRHHRLDRALDHAQRRVIRAKHHRHNGPPPASK